uniref:Major facilitator superfamily (MFS) profile domain-containing protein n=1 Tax=Branchiostoma floridae TaxID=7739 RepID=C3ZFC4_BRAFL|eukprot:XP_002592667.1 hypothetical protein BRAFLDRAFT_118384 [Branchiostoma floridae]
MSDTDLHATYGDFMEAHPVANRTQIPCDHGYQHDTSEYKSTIVTDWDLVCSESWKVSLAESLWFAGLMVGAVFGGHAADRWGRKPVLLASLAIDYMFGIICAFSPNYAAFVSFRAVIAACTMVSVLVPFVMATELVSPDKRSLVGMVIWIYWAIGYVILSGIAYLIRTWMWLQIAVTMPYLFFISFWWLVPESPRWLISRNRHEEAAAILRNAAEFAKVVIPDEVFHDTIPLTQTEEKTKEKEKLYTFVDLFRTPNLRKWTVNIFFNWVVNTFVYYGISLNTAALSGNLYLNFAISGFIEIPAYLISIIILDKFGRRWPLCLMLLFGGVACIVAFFIPKHLGWMTTTLAMTGKFCITASFAVVYVFSAEIFPTVVRQIGIGMSSMSARVGGMVAPFVNLLGSYWAPMPYVIFGGVSIAAGLLALLLPETVGKKLPSTIEEGENLRKKDAIVDEDYSYSLLDTTIYATYRDFLKAHPVANRTQIPCDDGYEYDTSEYTSTVATEWNLVCDNSWKVNLAKSLWFAGIMAGAVFGGHAADSWKVNLAKSLWFAGIMAGAVFGGHAADRWGRRPVLLASLVVDYVSGIACAFSPNYTFFMAIRFIISASNTVSTLALYVMAQELVSADKRSMVGMVIWIPYALAYVLLPGIAYFVRTWMWLQIAITMPFLFFISFWWIVNTLVYYGISLNTAALSGNMYLNFAISGFVEIPAYILSIFILNRFGRRWPLCLMLLFGGVACIVAFFIPKHLGWMTTTLAMAGKFCITATFAIIYVFSAEIFPTVVRSE